MELTSPPLVTHGIEKWKNKQSRKNFCTAIQSKLMSRDILLRLPRPDPSWMWISTDLGATGTILPFIVIFCRKNRVLTQSKRNTMIMMALKGVLCRTKNFFVLSRWFL